MKTFTHRDGVLRFYDGTATPYFVALLFVDAGLRAPTGRDREQEVLVMNRGRLDTNAHYVMGPDDPIMAPLGFAFTCKLANTEPNLTKIRQILNADVLGSFAVGTNTWVTTKAKSQVMIGGPSPASVTTPTFGSSRKRTVDVQVLWTDPDSANNLGYKWQEIYFPPNRQEVTEGADGVTLAINGEIYGNITTITAFTAGTAG